MKLSRREREAFSLASVVRQLTAAGLGGSFEAELLQDVATEAGRSFDASRPIIPWSLLGRRDMTVAGVSGSEILVDSDVTTAVDILRPVSVTARAGVTFLPGLAFNQALPKVTAPTSTFWLTDDTAPITESQPTIGTVIQMAPKIGGAFVQYSRLLTLQSQVEDLIRRDVRRSVGALLDGAVLTGTGASGQPTGLFNTSGVGTQPGTSLAWSGVLAMEEASATANGEPSAWIASPATREILKGRERAAGSGFIWDDNRIGGTPAFGTMAATVSLLTEDLRSCTRRFPRPSPSPHC